MQLTRFSARSPWRASTLILTMFAMLSAAIPANTAAEDPWKAEQTVQPEQFAEELQQGKDGVAVVIYVGVKVLYEGGHIPGAVYYGAGSSGQGISDLKKYAQALPKSSNVVLYCGCCPLERCPNLRPAFNALKDAGFAKLRVLILPHSFSVDWVEKGYPVHKGSEP